jgi:hypothetical protein
LFIVLNRLQPRVIGTALKKTVGVPFKGKLWQRNYYEHIIRNEDELNRVGQYIADNPAMNAACIRISMLPRSVRSAIFQQRIYFY